MKVDLGPGSGSASSWLPRPCPVTEQGVGLVANRPLLGPNAMDEAALRLAPGHEEVPRRQGYLKKPTDEEDAVHGDGLRGWTRGVVAKRPKERLDAPARVVVAENLLGLQFAAAHHGHEIGRA